MTDFGKQAAQLAERMTELDRRLAEKRAEHDALGEQVKARQGELRAINAHLDELKQAIRGLKQ
jgi:hypothetical protein